MHNPIAPTIAPKITLRGVGLANHSTKTANG
jgi:hypothetical protein